MGPTIGRKCYITPAFSGVPKVKEDKIRIGGAHKWAEMLHHPCILGGPPRQGRQNQNWWGPKVGGKATSPQHSRGSPKARRTKSESVGPTSGRKCYITPAFSGIPKERGAKSEFVGPTSGRKCYITPAFSGVPKDKGDKIRINGAQKVGGNATSPLHSRGSPKTRGTKSE